MGTEEAHTWRLVITGCGTSHGSPPWGMPVFWSTDPRDRRRRSGAVLLGPGGAVILIDAGPDLAHQLTDPYRDWDGVTYPLRAIVRCDAVLITHDHADHTHGINDLRHLNRLMGGVGIDLYGAEEHLAEIRRMFGYCFGGADDPAVAVPLLRERGVADGDRLRIRSLDLEAVVYGHGPAGSVTGWIIAGRVAYLTDCKTVPTTALRRLRGLDLLVLTMLQEETHPTHCNWDEARTLVDVLAPRRVVFTHMGYSVRYDEWETRLPAGMELAYDGMVLPLDDEGDGDA